MMTAAKFLGLVWRRVVWEIAEEAAPVGVVVAVVVGGRQPSPV